MNGQLNLTGVPETMLWTLYNRASEARRPDAFLVDPECLRIFEAIDYDYAGSFGKAEAAHPMRSRIFDDVLRPWLRAHPGASVVELAAGLETQLQRCDDGRVRWYCVDLPEAIAVRDRFLPARERCSHIRQSALDLSWMDQVDGSRGLFVTAQGLFMYFTEAEVRRVLGELFARFPAVELMFDAIPRWFSSKTLRGFAKTPAYTVPPMPWGINSDEIEPTLRTWFPAITAVEVQPYGLARGWGAVVLRLCRVLGFLRNLAPTIVRVSTEERRRHGLPEFLVNRASAR